MKPAFDNLKEFIINIIPFKRKPNISLDNLVRLYYRRTATTILEELIAYKTIPQQQEEVNEIEIKFQSAHFSDREFIERLKKSERLAFVQLYDRHYRQIESMVLSASGNTDDARDVFQNAMILLVEKAQKERLNIESSVGTYLYAVSKNLWMNELRKRNVRKRYKQAFTLQDDDQLTAFEVPDHFDQIVTIIDELGDTCKQLLEKFYFENQNWDEISASMGYSSTAVARNQKYKCLEQLRRKVRKWVNLQ